MFNDKTNRGFGITKFTDSYGEVCSVQESSSIDPSLWIGVDNPSARILSSNGWVDYHIPDDVQLHSRMHLRYDDVKKLRDLLTDWLEIEG